MSPSLAFFFSFFFLLSTSSYAFNITTILSQYSDFSTFNDQLTQTHLAGTINSRKTLTILAVDNGGMSGVSGKSSDDLKKILSLHVVLDYYDVQKLNHMENKSNILTTLFQSTGQANGEQGFLNATKTDNGVVFGSAVPGSSLSSSLMKAVVAEPYNVSVLQVSSVIVPSNMGSSSNNSSSNSTAPTTSPSPTASPPKSSSASPPKPSSKASPPPSNATSPSDSSPPKPDSPPADVPASSDSPPADKPAENKKSSAGSLNIRYNSLGLGLGAGALLWSLFMGAW